MGVISVVDVSYYDLRTPIRALVLKENYNFALAFPVDVRKDVKVELYFFRVARVWQLKRVYVFPELPPYSPPVTGVIDFTFLGEAGPGVGDDVFTMFEERPYRILHFAVGIHPPKLRVYVQQPSGYTVTGWSRKVPTGIGDPVDYVTGEDSPYQEPTRAAEFVMWMKGSINFGLVNAGPVSAYPRFNIVGAGYDAWLLTDRMLADKMVKGVVPCRFISVGGLAEAKYTVPEEWKGRGFTYGLSEVQALLRGG